MPRLPNSKSLRSGATERRGRDVAANSARQDQLVNTVANLAGKVCTVQRAERLKQAIKEAAAPAKPVEPGAAPRTVYSSSWKFGWRSKEQAAKRGIAPKK